mmetsp:Transcript_18478/g.29407  ORF Transcript_18478/g.29407 Transcript_18478/m.29407 type:complete len:151 (-) Transcript_18478:12-464(-)
MANISTEVKDECKRMHDSMLAKARHQLKSRIRTVTRWEDFVLALQESCLVLAPWCGDSIVEETIKVRTATGSIAVPEINDQDGSIPNKEKDASAMSSKTATAANTTTTSLTGAAKALCIPFDQPPLPPGTKCIGDASREAKMWVLFGRSY